MSAGNDNTPARERPIGLSTIGALIDFKMTLRVHCNTWDCMHAGTVDLNALAARIGRDHSCLAPEIKRYFRCTECGGRNVGFILSPFFDQQAYSESQASLTSPGEIGRPETRHRSRRSRRNKSFAK